VESEEQQRAEAELKIGRIMLFSGKPHQALPHLQEAVDLAPTSAVAQLNLGHALLECGQAKAAEVAARGSLALRPDGRSAPLLLARVLQHLGRFDEAIEEFEVALSRDPSSVAAYFGVAYSKRFSKEDAGLVRQMLDLATAGAMAAKDRERALLLYSLGKVHEDLAEYQSAAEFFDAANRIELERRARQGLAFLPSRYARMTDSLIGSFNRDLLAHHAGLGNESTLPVFIVGMIRSGTTLLDQSLTAHRSISSAGELPFWRDHGQAIFESVASGKLDPHLIRNTADGYLGVLLEQAAGSRFVIDKMPMNFLALGAIHLAFPKARVIHCVREPADTCLSVFVTPFRAAPEFAHSRKHIVSAYLEYRRLMDYWRAVLPSTSILDVRYEDIVTDRQKGVGRVLEFLGLDWDDACLSEDQPCQAVNTPSQWQVRQPIYRTSIDRWRNYPMWQIDFTPLFTKP
jgi:tetratricopeptide (TPR) repeat protein